MKIRLKCTSMKNFKVLGLMKVNVKRYLGINTHMS